MSNFSNSIEKIGKAGIRKGFITEGQFQQAQTMAQKLPEISFIDLLAKLGFITDIQKKELQGFLKNYESMVSTLPSLPEDNEESVMLMPLEEEEEETDEESTDSLLMSVNADSASLMLAPEPETILAEPSLKNKLPVLVLLPEAATLPTFQDLLKNLPSIPIEDKFRFANKEDEEFSTYTIEQKLLSRETIEVLLEMQKNLKKMEVYFPIAQLVKEFSYLEEKLISSVQTSLNCKSTRLKNYSLSKAENQSVSQKTHFFCSKEVLTEVKKVQEYFNRLGLEKSLAEVLLIQGHYQSGDIQKLSTKGSRISSTRRASGLSSTTRAPSSSNRTIHSKKRR